MQPEDEESRLAGNEAATKRVDQDRGHSVTDWTVVYDCAEHWIRWTARRRWPDFPSNDAIWASSVADWATSGRRAA